MNICSSVVLFIHQWRYLLWLMAFTGKIRQLFVCPSPHKLSSFYVIICYDVAEAIMQSIRKSTLVGRRQCGYPVMDWHHSPPTPTSASFSARRLLYQAPANSCDPEQDWSDRGWMDGRTRTHLLLTGNDKLLMDTVNNRPLHKSSSLSYSYDDNNVLHLAFLAHSHSDNAFNWFF